jgi:carboxypeptidase C (cathepsin A)
VTKAQLADVEHYATGEYLADILAGERDPAAIERRSSQVAAFTGLDPVLVRRYHGLIDMQVFLHALDAGQSQVGSAYDATVTDPDPFPLETLSEPPDPVLEGLKAPISSAMVSIYHDRLQWRPDTPYRLFGQQAAHQWQWPRGTRAQSVSFLRTALALDANLRVFVAHGLFDLVTPYLATQLMLAQIPRGAGAGRVRMEVYPGGHMFYTDDQSRAAWRSAAQDLYRAGAQALPAR